MAILSVHHHALIFGLLGNIVSLMVFLAPVPTFYTIWKKKTSEGFQVIPYIVALFSATLLLYYAYLKTNALLIITINGIGCVIEITYLIIYLLYAPKAAKMFTLTLILLFNVGLIGSMMVFTILFFTGPKRVKVVGWCCASVNVAVFAAPLGIMRRVIKTKSVEFMPFSLSFFLTLCAVMWFFYGFLIRDFFIALPNVLGFIFGITQIILYLIYKNAKKEVEMTCNKGHEGTEDQDANLNRSESCWWAKTCVHWLYRPSGTINNSDLSLELSSGGLHCLRTNLSRWLHKSVAHKFYSAGDAKIKIIVDDQSIESNENNA